MSGAICDKRMSIKSKSKVYRTVIKPALLYGSECWTPEKRQEQILNRVEIKMFRWMLVQNKQISEV